MDRKQKAKTLKHYPPTNPTNTQAIATHDENTAGSQATPGGKERQSKPMGFWRDHNKVIAAATVVIAVVNGVYAFFAYRQLKVMDAANNISKDSIAASQRPWVSLDATISGPFTFNEQYGNAVIDFTIKNSGPSVATNVVFSQELYVESITKPNPIKERVRLCEEARKQGSFGDAVFPGDKRPLHYNLTATREEMERLGVKITVPPFGKVIPVDVIACVAYSSTLSEQRYYTGYIFDLLTEGGIRFPERVESNRLMLFSQSAGAVNAH